MEAPPKTIATLGFTLGASAYFAIGVLGSLGGIDPRLVPLLSVLSSLLAGAAVPLGVRGIARVRALRDGIPAREAPLADARPAG